MSKNFICRTPIMDDLINTIEEYEKNQNSEIQEEKMNNDIPEMIVLIDEMIEKVLQEKEMDMVRNNNVKNNLF